MVRLSVTLMAAALLAGCAASPATFVAKTSTVETPSSTNKPATEKPSEPAQVAASTEDAPRDTGTWIGAAPTSDFVLHGQRETLLGVWIDIPQGAARTRAKSAIALVVDTSGSMAGAKIEHARAAAHRFVDSLPDGDIVSIQAFSDSAEDRIPPQVLEPSTRRVVHSAIDMLNAAGGTNLFDGLKLAELRVAGTPSSHPVRRVVLVSDGVATVGPTSSDLLGSIAEKGADHGIQVTAIGVGLDYDERTLNALAVRSSGRLHHIGSPDDMTNVLAEETRLFAGTRATDAVVEIIPAPGVSIVSIAGARSTWSDGGAMRVPLGAMFGGQHREMAIRVRIDDPGAAGARPLASVRLHFRDPAEQGLSRVQEVVARFEMTDDPKMVASHENERARTIVAVNEASEAAIAAAQDVNEGRFDKAAEKLAQVESKLSSVAGSVRDEKEKQRVLAVAKKMGNARASSQAAAAAPAAAPAPARRAKALEINADAMNAAGF